MKTFLTDQGINIFDLDDPFYTDLCYDFDNPNDRDIPLSKRIETVYPDVSLCDEGCQMNGIDLATMTASCDCKFNDIANSNLIQENAALESVVGEALDIINASNILVLKCYKYIFKRFKESIGGMISIAAIAGHLTSVALYFLIGRNKIKTYIYNIYEHFLSFVEKLGRNIKDFPPKRRKANVKLTIEDEKIKSQRVDTNSELYKSKIRIEKREVNKYDADKTYKEIIKFREGGNIKKVSEKNLLFDKYLISNKLGKKHKVRYRNLGLSRKRGKKEDDFQEFFDEYLATSLDDMEYDDAIIKDHRSFCEYFKECLKEKQMIAFTFIATDPLKIRFIKIMLFLLNIVLYFVVTGLFFSEEYIGELYDIDPDDEGFFDYIPRSIDKFIYTTIVSVVIGYIIDCFFVDEKKIKGIFRREKENLVNLRSEIVGFIKEIQTRYLSFIIVILVLLLYSFYYLLRFNYVYPKTQLEWVKASLTIFIIMQILSILKCFLKTCLRFLSFRCESEKLFKFSNLFG